MRVVHMNARLARALQPNWPLFTAPIQWTTIVVHWVAYSMWSPIELSLCQGGEGREGSQVRRRSRGTVAAVRYKG